jgi:hypothetical protein
MCAGLQPFNAIVRTLSYSHDAGVGVAYIGEAFKGSLALNLKPSPSSAVFGI